MSAYGKVAIVIGSRSDYDVAKPAVTVLDRFGVESEIRIISAHRSPRKRTTSPFPRRNAASRCL